MAVLRRRLDAARVHHLVRLKRLLEPSGLPLLFNILLRPSVALKVLEPDVEPVKIGQSRQQRGPRLLLEPPEGKFLDLVDDVLLLRRNLKHGGVVLAQRH